MGKIAVMFPGQGSQYVGMGKDFYDNYAVSKEIFRKADESLGFNLSSIIFEGNDAELKKTENTQPAILTVCIAIYEACKNLINVDAMLGLSLGEYAALVAGGALNFSDAVKLTKLRGKLMQDEVPENVGKMAAIIGLSREDIYEICSIASAKGIVDVSNLNAPNQIVISGQKEAVDFAIGLAKEKGAKRITELNVSAPFHSRLLTGAGEKFRKALEGINFENLKIPVVSNVTAEFLDINHIKDLLSRQIYSTVNFEDSIDYLINQGFDTFIEIGPGNVLSSLTRRINRTVKTLNVENIQTLKKTISELNVA